MRLERSAERDKRELVGARPLHLADARPFGRLKAPLGLSLLRNRGRFGVTFSRERVVKANGMLLRSAYRRRAATINRRNTKNPLAQRLGFFVWSPTALGSLGASSPFFMDPAR